MAPAKSRQPPHLLLYEGNFEEWRRHMYTVFLDKRIRQVKDSLRYGASLGGPLYIAGASISGDKYTIRPQVSPGLLARVPVDLWQRPRDVEEIYAGLKKLCLPFRLMDLPAELRVNIYDEVIKGEEECVQRKDRTWTITPARRMPALAQTTRQLRQEVLPIYFSTTTFHIDIDMDVAEGYLDKRLNYCDGLAALTQDWSRNCVGASATHLRRITLDLSVLDLSEPLDSRAKVELVFSKSRGYRVCYGEEMSIRTRDQIAKHEKRVNYARKIGGFNGESILWALVQDCRVWDYTNLCLGKDMFRLDE